MTISDLPRELTEEILSGVPLRSMRAVRLTCKKWDTLSKNRSFTKIHAAKEGNSRMMVLLMDYKLYLMSVVVNGGGDPYAELQGELTCLNDKDSTLQVEISQIFQCEGLLLCVLKDTLRLVVWNPYWGQTRWIEPRYSFDTLYRTVDIYRYALGYSKNNKSLKILRFVDEKLGSYYPLNPPVRERYSWYEIYDFESGLWKTLGVTPPWVISKYNRGLSLKGNTYWICEESKVLHMICFDFTRERFGRLLPLPCRVQPWDHVRLSCVREEKIAALFQQGGDEEAFRVEIWITTKIEAEEVLWSKFLMVDMETVADIPIAVNYGSFLVDEEKRLAMFFDVENVEESGIIKNLRHSISIVGQDGYFRQVDLGESGYTKWNQRICLEVYCWTHASYYLPSLVQIKQLSGSKRKKQSSLEKRTCDQNTARLAALSKRLKEEFLPLPIFKV